jgi:hypothetical protein
MRVLPEANMEPRRIYISHLLEDAERVQPLRDVLQAAGLTIMTGWPEAIRSAATFLACFSASGDGSTNYHREELQRGIEQAPSRPAGWLMLVQLTPCVIPELPGIPRDAAVLDLQTRWYESVAHVIAPPASTGPSATYSFTTDQQQVGGNMRMTNVDTRNGALGGDANVRSEITAKSVVVDGDFDFTNLVNRGD